MLRPDWAGSKITNDEGKEVGYYREDGAIRIILPGSATDAADIQQHVFTKRAKRRLGKRFAEDRDCPLHGLTGFDAQVISFLRSAQQL